MGSGWPEPEVAEDLFDHCVLVNEADDPHRPAALRTQQVVSIVDLCDAWAHRAWPEWAASRRADGSPSVEIARARKALRTFIAGFLVGVDG